jgi:ribosome-binding ATPase YchF (GTP1/OBG family)
VRCFEDDNVVHVAGKVNPVSDIETINTELALADMATVDKQLAKYAKSARAGGDKEAQRLVAALEKVQVVLNEARPAMSTNSTTAGIVFSGFAIAVSAARRASGTSTMPTLGSMVQNG